MNFPPALKGIQPYLILAKQFERRDMVVSYFCKMYAVEIGIKMAKDQAAKGSILQLMDELQKMKQQLKTDPDYIDVLSHDDVAQTHVETTALKLFEAADTLDRAAKFNKGLIKMFFTASHLFCVLKMQQFGGLPEEMETKMKYAKWKAVEIDRCLKNGIEPTPGPPVEEEDEFAGIESGMGGVTVQDQPPPFGFNAESDPMMRPHGVPPGAAAVLPPPPSAFEEQRPVPAPRKNPPSPATTYHAPPQPVAPAPQPLVAPVPQAAGSTIPSSGIAKLSRAQTTQAQKYCKFASSSLDYDDYQSAANFMEKALRLLRTGRED